MTYSEFEKCNHICDYEKRCKSCNNKIIDCSCVVKKESLKNHIGFLKEQIKIAQEYINKAEKELGA